MRTASLMMMTAASLLWIGCDAPGSSDPNAPSKAEAQAIAEANGGKDDDGTDICAEYGWYSDGLCDPWCLLRDDDCDPCVYEWITCGVGELAVDTNDNECADTCVPDPEYHAPHQLALDDPCTLSLDCPEDAYCAKEPGTCDDGEPASGTTLTLTMCRPSFFMTVSRTW